MKQTQTQSLAGAVRAAGRRFGRGESIDITAALALIPAWCTLRPLDGLRLQSLLDAAFADAARDDRNAALGHFRAAIQFVCDCDDALKPRWKATEK